jgi:hypothetical protein
MLSSPAQLRLSGFAVHRHLRPDPGGLANMFGVKVSVPSRAVIESAAVLSDRDLSVALDSLVQTRRVSLDRLDRAMEELGWFRGRLTLKQIVANRQNGAGIVRSFLEYDSHRLLVRNHIPVGISNHEIRLGNGQRRVLDRAWPEHRIGLEAHSWQYHSNTTDWGRTMIRDRSVLVAGWTILPVVVEDTRSPKALLADMRSALARS